MNTKALVVHCNVIHLDLRKIVTELVSREDSLVIYSPGEALREEARKKSELWMRARAQLDSGSPLSERTEEELMRGKLQALPEGSRLVFLNAVRNDRQFRLASKLTRLIDPFYFLDVSESYLRRSILTEWETNSRSALRKYYPSLAEINAYVERQVKLKRHSEAFPAQSERFEKIDVSGLSDHAIEQIVKEKIFTSV